MRTLRLFFATFLLLSPLLTIGQRGFYSTYHEGKKVGLKDPNGKVAIPAKYQLINEKYFSDIVTPSMGYFRVTIKDKVGLINIKGEEILVPTYDYISAFSDSLAVAFLKDNVYILNVEGKAINSFKLKTKKRIASPFKHGIAFIHSETGVDGDIDIISQTAILGTINNFKYLGTIKAISSKYFLLKDYGTFSEYALYDVSGKRLSNNIYREIYPPDEQNYFYATKYINKKTTYGYINNSFSEVIAFGGPISSFNKSNLALRENKLINRKNEVVKQFGLDTLLGVMSNSKYYTYHIRKNIYIGKIAYGILNDSFKPITDPIFAGGSLKSIADKEFEYKPGATLFSIDEKGTVHPTNIAHEYETLLTIIPSANDDRWPLEKWSNFNMLLQRAVNKKYPQALKFRDSLYGDSLYLAQNKQVADPNLEKKAIAGNINSMYELGKAYINGNSGYPKNPEKGTEWLQVAANKNLQKAAYELVYHYIKNHDENKAQQFLNNYKGATKGADHGLDDLYLPGGLQMALAKYSANNEQQQEIFYNKAISLGNLNASYEFGVKLISSNDAAKITKGLNLLNNIALKGYVRSMITLGNYYNVTAKNKTSADRIKSNGYYNMVLRSNTASMYERQEANQGIDKNLGIDRNKVACTNCKGSGKVTWDKPLTYYQNYDKDGNTTWFKGKQTTTVKTTENCPICLGTGLAKKKN